MLWFMAQMTRDDWFRIAGEQLVRHGESALTIQSLTRQAGVTHGSYYHHFGSQAGFVEAFVEHLTERAFVDVSAQVDHDASTPVGAREALRRLVEVIASKDLRLEAAVRRWAHGNPTVAAVVDRIDAQRGELLFRLFLVATGDQEKAAFLARLNGAVYLGAVYSKPPIEGGEYSRMAHTLEHLLDQTR